LVIAVHLILFYLLHVHAEIVPIIQWFGTIPMILYLKLLFFYVLFFVDHFLVNLFFVVVVPSL